MIGDYLSHSFVFAGNLVLKVLVLHWSCAWLCWHPCLLHWTLQLCWLCFRGALALTLPASHGKCFTGIELLQHPPQHQITTSPPQPPAYLVCGVFSPFFLFEHSFWWPSLGHGKMSNCRDRNLGDPQFFPQWVLGFSDSSHSSENSVLAVAMNIILLLHAGLEKLHQCPIWGSQTGADWSGKLPKTVRGTSLCI